MIRFAAALLASLFMGGAAQAAKPALHNLPFKQAAPGSASDRPAHWNVWEFGAKLARECAPACALRFSSERPGQHAAANQWTPVDSTLAGRCSVWVDSLHDMLKPAEARALIAQLTDNPATAGKRVPAEAAAALETNRARLADKGYAGALIDLKIQRLRSDQYLVKQVGAPRTGNACDILAPGAGTLEAVLANGLWKHSFVDLGNGAASWPSQPVNVREMGTAPEVITPARSYDGLIYIDTVTPADRL